MAVKIGFIGVGGIARHHMKQLEQLPNAQLVSFFDVNKEAATEVAAAYNATVADSAQQLLDQGQVDAVYICTPQFARGELELEAARRGIPFFVEKPLGVEMELVQRKEQVIRESGVIHAVGYVLRYYDTVEEARQFLQNKDIFMVQGIRLGGSHGSKWWNQLHMSGGHLNDAATHQVDMIRYIAGEFRDVYASFSRVAARERLGDDEATIYSGGSLSFTLQSGAAGSMIESCISKYQKGSNVEVYGSDFFLQLSANGRKLTITDDSGTRTREADNECFLEQARTFVDAVETGSREKIKCDYSDGLRTLAFSLGANQSAVERRPISLDQ